MGPTSCLCSMASRENGKFCDSGDMAKGQKINRLPLGTRETNPAAVFGGSVWLSNLLVTPLVQLLSECRGFGETEGSKPKPLRVSWVLTHMSNSWL